MASQKCVLAYVTYTWQEHEALVRGREDMEKQLEEQTKTVETQKKRYAEMEVQCNDLYVSIESGPLGVLLCIAVHNHILYIYVYMYACIV